MIKITEHIIFYNATFFFAVKRRAKSVKDSEILKWNLHICSENNFPTAAGLASSAAGYACVVSALAALYSVQGDVSSIARRGSGSACRSVFGGWVQWHKGILADGSDSIATQIAPPSHWPEMRILVLVVSDSQKKASSTSAMKRSVENSELLRFRIENSVPKRVDMMAKAIKSRDFHTFAEITMKDSNQFHAICQDTYPPCNYMNDVSHAIVEMVHAYNSYHGANKVKVWSFMDKKELRIAIPGCVYVRCWPKRLSLPFGTRNPTSGRSNQHGIPPNQQYCRVHQRISDHRSAFTRRHPFKERRSTQAGVD